MLDNKENLEHLKTYIKAKFPFSEEIVLKNMLEVIVPPAYLVKLLGFLKDDLRCDFAQLSDMTAVDDPKYEKRFSVVYTLLSVSLKQRILVKVSVKEEDEIPSLHKLYPNCVWYEREIYDMFGVRFLNTPDDRRILTDYDFEGHPLRKDFPTRGGFELYYDEDVQTCLYRSLETNG